MKYARFWDSSVIHGVRGNWEKTLCGRKRDRRDGRWNFYPELRKWPRPTCRRCLDVAKKEGLK